MRYNKFLKRMMLKHTILREDAKLALDLVFSTLKDVLLEGEEVPIPRFGTFHPRYTKSREWVQPSSGDTIVLKPRVRLNFRSTRYFDKQMTLALGDAHVKKDSSQQALEEAEDETDFAEDEADDGGVEEDA